MLAKGAGWEQGWSRTARLANRLPRLWREMQARPGWLLFFVFGRMPLARALAVRLLAARAPASVAGTAAAAEALAPGGVAAVVALLRRDGLVTGLRLPDATVEAIRAHAEQHPCSGGPDWNIAFPVAEHAAAERRHGRPLLVAALPEPDRHCPAIAALLRNDWLHDVARAYLRAPPQIIDVRLLWSFPGEAANRTELGLAAQDSFHFDLGDWQQLKFFFYLVEVGPRNGAHLYVRGSHARRRPAQQFPLFSARSARQIADAFGHDAIELVTGPAGSGFVEDPFGFHTGTKVQEGRRLMLEISFGITGVTRRRSFAARGG